MNGDTTNGTAAGTAAGMPSASNDTEDAMSRVLAELADADERGIPTYAALSKRNKATGKDEIVRKYTPAEFDVFKVGEEFGGGNYIVRCRTGAKWGASARFDVAGRVQAPTLTPISAAPAAEPTPRGFSQDGLLGLIMQQAAQSQQMMMGIVTAVLQKPSSPSAGLGEVVGALEAMDRLRRGGGGEDEAGGGEEDTIASVLQTALTQPAAPAGEKPEQEAAEVDRGKVLRALKARAMIAGRIGTLAAMARAAFKANTPPEQLARLIRGVCRELKCDVRATLDLTVRAMKERGLSELEMVYGFQVHKALTAATGADRPAANTPKPAPVEQSHGDVEGAEGGEGEAEEGEGEGEEGGGLDYTGHE